jgi:hypothetical protein
MAGLWPVPGAEYALSPVRIERQARAKAKSVPEPLAALIRECREAMAVIDGK